MNSLKIFFLLLGDIIALYASLLIALALRYGPRFYQEFLDIHVVPFTIVFVAWIILFYIAGLYDLRRLHNNIDFLKTLLLAIAFDAIVAILLFYFVSSFGIAPKTNLFIFLVIFVVVEIAWRRLANTFLASGEAPNRVVIAGDGSAVDEIVKAIHENPQFGYAIVGRIEEQNDPRVLEQTIVDYHANMIAVPRHLKKDTTFALALYSLFGKGIAVVDIADLYERVLRKVPLADVEETWFLENIEGAGRYYDSLKRAGEFTFALVGGIVLLPIELIAAILVKLSSPGPAIYRQTRIGQNGKPFTLYKFRTMRQSEKNAWLDKDRARVTGVGKILRSTHIDELPQFINLLRGDISLVGPRPDFIEFYEKLERAIPYYSIRTIIKPGITGWAQVAFPVTESLEQTKERLCYDIYYLKNRSLIFDFLIVLRTLKTALTASGK